ncbi:MAG: amidotransferase [Deltaproteobacteria bacterium]|nr:amidotransferase [Deltaproteobacteria bacterium]
MRLHYLQHVSFEGLGSIADWARKRNIRTSGTRLFLREPLPDPADFDLLIVMGGPMNIYEIDVYPWLVEEKAFIRRAIDQGKQVLGVCLGAQLIADALGARVYRNEHKEIGWFPIQLAAEAPQGLRNIFSQTTEVMHWHGDTFDLPDGCLRLASSRGCLNQGFVRGGGVLALQFHLETTRHGLADLIAHCGDEIIEAPFIQRPEEMLADDARFGAVNRMMHDLLDSWAAGLLPSPPPPQAGE